MSDGDFCTLSLQAAISYLEISHHKLRRGTSFLKHLAELEASYAKDLLKLVSTGESTYREKDDKKGASHTCPSDVLFFTAVDAIKRMANQHATYAKELQTQVAAPLKEFRLKAEDARKKFQQTHSKLQSQLKDTTDSIVKERTACAKLLEQYRAESKGEAVPEKSKSLFGKKTVADKASVSKALTTYQNNWQAAQNLQKSQHEIETKTLKEIQGWEEEKVKIMKTCYTHHSELLKEHIIEPLANMNVDLDAKLQEYKPTEEIKAILDQRMVAKREQFTWIPYELPCAASDVSDDSFLSGKPNSVAKGGPTTEMKAPLTVGGSSSSESESKGPAPVPSSVSNKFATSASSSIVPNQPSKIAPAAAASDSSVAAKASKMGAVPLGMFTPGAAASGPPKPSAASAVSSPTSPTEKPTNDDTFIKVKLPSNLGHITLAASQLPSVKLIKTKIISKLERQGKLDQLPTTTINAGEFRLCVAGSSGIDIPESSSMNSLLDTAKMYLPPGKPIELELVVSADSSSGAGANNASPRISPTPAPTSTSTSTSTTSTSSDGTTTPEIQHVDRAKIVRKKKPAKKGFSTLFKKTTAKKKTKPATGGIGAFNAISTSGDSSATGITLTTSEGGNTEQHEGDDDEEDSSENEEGEEGEEEEEGEEHEEEGEADDDKDKK